MKTPRRFPTSRAGGSADSGERRREPRRRYSGQLLLQVLSPAWAITPLPLVGEARNISMVGVKIGGLNTEPGQLEAWSEAIANDEELKVQVEPKDQQGFPPLAGRLVWVYQESGAGNPTECTVGVLFSVPKPSEAAGLEELMNGLPVES
jgi:hypothetical protein